MVGVYDYLGQETPESRALPVKEVDTGNWSRNEKLALAGLVISALSLVITVALTREARVIEEEQNR